MGFVQLLTAATAANGAPTAVRTVASITTVAGASLLDGERVVINDGKKLQIFEFDKAGVQTDFSKSLNALRIPVTGLTADQVRDALITAINGAGLDVVAASGGAATVTITHNRPGANFITISETVANGGFAVSITTAGSLSGVAIGHDSSPDNDDNQVIVYTTAGSGTMTAQVTIWGYLEATRGWSKVKALNAGAAIAETSADVINYAETVVGLRQFSRLYAELVAVAGTSTAVNVAVQAKQ